MKLTHKTNWERGKGERGRGERQREKLLWFPTILQSWFHSNVSIDHPFSPTPENEFSAFYYALTNNICKSVIQDLEKFSSTKYLRRGKVVYICYYTKIKAILQVKEKILTSNFSLLNPSKPNAWIYTGEAQAWLLQSSTGVKSSAAGAMKHQNPYTFIIMNTFYLPSWFSV